MKTVLLLVCASACAVVAQASTFCAFSPGTWCEQPIGPDAGQYLSTAQQTYGYGSLNTIIGEINGLGGADLFAVNIQNTSDFAASFTPASGTGPRGGTIKGDSDAALYLFTLNGMGIEAADDGVALTGFSGASGIYLIGISGDGNLPEDGPLGSRSPIFSTFVSGQVSLPVAGAGPLDAYTGNGCGKNCAGGYDISLTGAQYSAVPEPASIALTGSMLSALGLLFRLRRKS